MISVRHRLRTRPSKFGCAFIAEYFHAAADTRQLSRNLSEAQWATPFEMHTPPVEDGGKNSYRGRMYSKWIISLDTSTRSPYTLCGRFHLSQAQQRVCKFQIELRGKGIPSQNSACSVCYLKK